MNKVQDLQKWIKLAGDRAKLDAKANNSYIVYKNDVIISCTPCTI